jgi:hypothetical protein
MHMTFSISQPRFHIRPKVTTFHLNRANEALATIKKDSIDGAAVIIPLTYVYAARGQASITGCNSVHIWKAIVLARCADSIAYNTSAWYANCML